MCSKLSIRDDYCSHVTRLKHGQDILSQFVLALNKLQLNDDFPNIVETMLDCKGKIVTTGMGKAGIAMRKFTATLCSLGLPSCYIHPGEASHGDLGLLREDDILFVASTSGKTREVIEIVNLSRELNVSKVIGITSHPDSKIRDKADIILDMGIIEEAGHLGLAPTTSILVLLALTDTLALVCAEEKNLTKEQYGKYHHSGYLGSAAREDSKIH